MKKATVRVFARTHPNAGKPVPDGMQVDPSQVQQFSGTPAELKAVAVALDDSNADTYDRWVAALIMNKVREMLASPEGVTTDKADAGTLAPGVRVWAHGSEWAVVDVEYPAAGYGWLVASLVWTGRGLEVYPLDMRSSMAINLAPGRQVDVTRPKGTPAALTELVHTYEALRGIDGEPFNSFNPPTDAQAQQWANACELLRAVDWTAYDA